ncbi:type II toxin-antitoxin system Phd/YefM family antitoxin [Nostoc sp.]|uniref:type II toxin-antitoxin system Phd/YefM family antitoxin n=1 Tax=Nostoc sp. TaxID=1180 RepID=UPI002FF9507A
MTWISVDEIKRDLLGYLQRVEAGETLIIIRGGKPIAEIKPTLKTPNISRPFGLCTGEFIVPDDFDEPLPENIISEFQGK